VIRDLPEGLQMPAPDYIPESERATFMGFRRPDGRVGTRNFVLIVPTSMCASHEAQQISIIAEYTLFSRQQFPNVDGVVAIPHNKGCGCQDGSTIDVMLRNTFKLCRSSECRRRGADRSGLRKKTNLGGG
jgi:altronate hydrolase